MSTHMPKDISRAPISQADRGHGETIQLCSCMTKLEHMMRFEGKSRHIAQVNSCKNFCWLSIVHLQVAFWMHRWGCFFWGFAHLQRASVLPVVTSGYQQVQKLTVLFVWAGTHAFPAIL